MHPTPPLPAGTATLLGAAHVFEEAIRRFSDLGLFVSPAAGQIFGAAIYTLHLASTRADVFLTNAAHFAGQQLAGGDAEAFATTVANANALRRSLDHRTGSALPIDAVEQVIGALRATVLVRGIAVYFGDYALDGLPDAIVVHLALTEELAFSSHVALLAGLQWRWEEPNEFERLARALADEADGR